MIAMFRSGAKILTAMICCIAVLFSFANLTTAAEPSDDDWTASISPTRVEVIIGESETFEITFNIFGDFVDVDGYLAHEVYIYMYEYDAPTGITISPWIPPPNYVYHRIVGDPGGYVGYRWTVTVASDFTSTSEQRVDITYLLFWDGANGGVQTLYKTVSLYVLPVGVISWDVISYSPNFVAMMDDETETLYMTIINNSSMSLDFDIAITLLHHGFGVSPASTSISIAPGYTYQWTTTLTCTGYGLDPDDEYIAVLWYVTCLKTGISKSGGGTKVVYVGAGEVSVDNIDMWWVPDRITVPFAEWENVTLVIKNIGDVNLTLTGDPSIRVSWLAVSPIWVYTYDDPGPAALAPDENLEILFSFWAHGDPDKLEDWSYTVARITDNFGNTREAMLGMRAVVGTFSLEINPLLLILQQGQVKDVYITVWNNENYNRNYIITANELTSEGVYWAKSIPDNENLALTPYAIGKVNLKVKALATHGEYPYVYYVHCEQTGLMGRLEISVKIIALPTGYFPGAFGSFLALLNPLTGSTESSGHVVSVIVVMMFAMIGLAVGGDSMSRLGAIIMTVFGITLVTVLGWFPSWIMGLTILILALGMARWMHDYF